LGHLFFLQSGTNIITYWKSADNKLAGYEANLEGCFNKIKALKEKAVSGIQDEIRRLTADIHHDWLNKLAELVVPLRNVQNRASDGLRECKKLRTVLDRSYQFAVADLAKKKEATTDRRDAAALDIASKFQSVWQIGLCFSLLFPLRCFIVKLICTEFIVGLKKGTLLTATEDQVFKKKRVRVMAGEEVEFLGEAYEKKPEYLKIKVLSTNEEGFYSSKHLKLVTPVAESPSDTLGSSSGGEDEDKDEASVSVSSIRARFPGPFDDPCDAPYGDPSDDDAHAGIVQENLEGGEDLGDQAPSGGEDLGDQAPRFA